jgi:hypothetical protein
MELQQFQEQVDRWARANFGDGTPPFHRPLVGANEEMGELCGVLADQLLELVPVMLAMQALGNVDRAQLKAEQGIRGSALEHEAKAKDGIADVIIYLSDYCTQKGWNLNEIVETAWIKVVQKRNWRANPTTGTPGDPVRGLEMLKEAAEDFVRKVDSGNARSVKTYGKFRDALAVLNGDG